MANNLTGNVSQLVLKKFAPGFTNTNVLLRAVDRQVIQGEINENTGESVRLKRPMQYKAIRTAGGDLTAQTSSALISGTIEARTSNMCTVFIEYTQIEEAIRLNQWDKILEPAYERMSTEIELELAAYILNNAGAGCLGTTGTAITKWSDVAQCGSFLTDLGLSVGRKYAIMDPWAAQALADKQSALGSGNVELIRTAWEDAQISGNFAGVRALMSNALANRTSGSAAGAASVTVKTTPDATYTVAKDTMRMTITLTGASLATKALKAGDQLSFPATSWINQQTKQVLFRNGSKVPFTATVLADASASGNDITVSVTTAPVFDTTNPQFNVVDRAVTAGDSVTILGAASTLYKPNIFMHEKAVAMGTVPLKRLKGWDSSVMTSESTGLSMRATEFSDPITGVQGMRIDLLPAFGLLIPQGVGHFYGNP
jgi:P22 coat protein - gene protein 5